MALHLFHGDKGGVGKSFAAAAFGEYLLGKARPITVVESDARNADAGRYFDGAAAVKKIDLRQTDGWIEFLTLLHQDENDDIIVSLPSGIGGVLTANAPRLLAAVADLKRSLTVWWVLSRTVDSVVLLAPVTTAFGTAPGVKVVALRNLHYGESGKFRRWNDGKVRDKFLKSGGIEADLPELHELAVDATFGAMPAKRFSVNGESGLEYGPKVFLREWVAEVTGTFDRLAEDVGVGKR
jgi:hypothetical protein